MLDGLSVVPLYFIYLRKELRSLTLTAASYAFLMEPHWNPTLEDQALARIHRLGQKNKVTTVRFVVRDSFEQVSSRKLLAKRAW
jgi:SNF2 family DNA or RNA helicase